MRHLLLFAIFSFLFSSCGTVSPFGSMSSDRETSKGATNSADRIEQGVASWYGPNFHGNLTANGEIYDMYELTAAHRTLPFDTVLRVKNLDNGKEVQVRINDRGPYAKNRIIDLSKKAAEEIDMIEQGTAKVSLHLVKGDLANANISDLAVPTYTVQIASFQDKQKALQHSRELDGSRIETIVSGDQTIYRVYYGVYEDANEAESIKKDLASQGIEGYVKQIQN